MKVYACVRGRRRVWMGGAEVGGASRRCVGSGVGGVRGGGVGVLRSINILFYLFRFSYFLG